MALNTSSLLFDGTNDHAKLSTSSTLKNLGTFTWMAWFKVGATSTTQFKRAYVERQGSGAGIRFAFTPTRGRLRFEFAPKDGTTDTNYDYSYTWDTRWHHAAFVARVGGTPSYEVFLDGLSVATGKLVVPAGTTVVSNTTPLGGSIYLGNYSLHTTGSDVFPSDRYWAGNLDEILIFNDSKNGTEILDYVSSNDTWATSDTEMISYWKFDENTGTTTTNTDTGGWTGTLYENNSASSALWTIDRPFLGNGTLDTTVPTTPTLPGTPTTLITADGFTATWNSTTDNVFVQFYELHVSTFSDFSSYTTYDMGRTLTKKVTGLLPATNYYWRVRAFDAENNASGYTATQSLTTSGTGDLTAPLPPTALVASQITHSSYRVSFTASASSDETGYKMDVATDQGFVNYLEGYRNKDVGNVSFVDVFGTSPLKTYYNRFRAYDAAENESVESAVLVVQTATIPDTTAPLVVELLPATSITSSAMTLNWEEGVDDIGVSYYQLDVATNDTFTNYLFANMVTWTNINVGNVTSFRLEGIAPETPLWYRVRAVDSAGNISQNPTDGMAATTTLPSVDEGGYISTIEPLMADAWVDSGATGVNHGTDATLSVQGSGAANTKAAYLLFDLSDEPGTIISAMLRLWVTDASTDQVSVSVDNVTFVENTITWANQPTVAGSTVAFTPAATGQWVSVDIGSLILDGPTTYTVKVWMNGTNLFTFDSKEGTNPPQLEVEVDPATATRVIEEFIFDTEDGQVINKIKNPSFEDNTTSFWTAFNNATISVLGTDAYVGTKCLQVVGSGSQADMGVFYSSTDIAALQNQWWSFVVALKSVSGGTSLTMRISEKASNGAQLATTSQVVTVATTEWRRFSMTRFTTQPTTAFVGIEIYSAGLVAATFKVDAALVMGGTNRRHEDPAYFDGNTSGASWTGTVNASTSRLNAAEGFADTTYTGDSDGDNSVVAYFKRSDSADWVYLDAVQTAFNNNRGTKRASMLYGPTYGSYNYIKNPSFEVDVTNWTLFNPNANASVLRVTDESDIGIASAQLTVGTGAGSALRSNTSVAAVGQIWNARCRVRIPTNMNARLQIRALTSAGAFISESTAVIGTSEMLGDDTWVDLSTTFTMPATTGYVDVAISVPSTIAGDVHIDKVYLGRTAIAYNNPYLDGDMPDGMWIGTPHASITGMRLSPNTSYDFMHIYTDPDGLVNAVGDDSYIVTGTSFTAPTADNAITTTAITLTPSTETMGVVVDYLGDDNNNMTAIMEYKRTDLSGWTAINPVYVRSSKQITGTISNLNPGTSYTVRVTVVDTDGIFGTNPMTAVGVTSTNFGSAEVQPTISFGGFVLMGRDDGQIGVSRHDAFGLPERRLQVENLPRVDGAIELQNLWGQRPISITGFVDGETRAELEDNKNALKRALAPKLQQLVIDTLSNQGRFYYATCSSLAIEEVAGENIRHLTWDAEFICADPFAYESALTVLPEFTAANAATVTVNNMGDLRVDPYFKIRTVHTTNVTFTITNNTTGERITPSTTIINGDRIIIDTTKLTVLKNGIDIDYAGGFPHLAPGGNEFVFSVSAPNGTPALLIEINWRHRFL